MKFGIKKVTANHLEGDNQQTFLHLNRFPLYNTTLYNKDKNCCCFVVLKELFFLLKMITENKPKIANDSYKIEGKGLLLF